MIRSLDPVALGQAFRTGQPFPSICIDDFLDRDVALDVARSYAQAFNAATVSRTFNAVNEKRKSQIVDSALFPPAVARLAEYCSSQRFRDLLSEVTGVPNLLWDPGFVGGGMHQTAAHGLLDVHVDFNRLEGIGWYRRVNLLLFLNEEWRDEWGGRLELWDRKVRRCVQSFLPILNRCVIFETSEISFHGVTACTCPPDIVRRSFAHYFYSKDPPAEASGREHATLFRARPDERMKRFVWMPMERMQRALRGAASHLRRRASRVLGRS